MLNLLHRLIDGKTTDGPDDEDNSSASNVSDVAIPEIGILGALIAVTLDRLVAGLNVHVDLLRKNAEIMNGPILF